MADRDQIRKIQFTGKSSYIVSLPKDWIKMLVMNRTETQEFLKNPTEPLDLIVPRGGERLIAFVKEHAKCAVLVSGRGNNFLYAVSYTHLTLPTKRIV